MAKKISNLSITQILLLSLIALFPLGQLTRVQFGSLGVTFSDCVAVVLFISFLLTHRKKLFVLLRKHSFIQPLGLFLFIGFISLLAHYYMFSFSTMVVSFAYTLRFIAYSSIFFVVSQGNENFKKTVTDWMIGVGAFTVLIGLLQYLLYPDLRPWFDLGWDKHLYRLFSGFLDPNFSGVYFVLYLIFLLGIFFEKKHLKNPLLLVFLFCTFVAIFLSFSRSALLMLLLSIPLLLFLRHKIKLLGLFIIACICVILLLPFLGQSEGTNLLRKTSSFSRIDSAKKAATIARENFIIGVGFNAYRYAQKQHGFLEEDNWETLHSGAGTDNSFMFVLATTGITGYFFYMYFWYKVLSHHLDKKTIISSVVVVSVLGLFIGSLFVNSLFFTPIMLWMWLLLGVSSSEES